MAEPCTVYGVGLGWANPRGRVTDRPDGIGTWQINLFHHRVQMRIKGGTQILPPASVICFSPRQAQWYCAADAFFHDDWLTCDGPLNELAQHYGVPIDQPFTIDNAAQVERCLRDMAHELRERPPFADDALVDLLRMLLRLMGRGLRRDGESDPRRLVIERLRGALRERCGEDWSVARMAATAGMSAHRFATLYRRWCGASPMRDLTGFRVRRAQSLFEEGGASIAEVAAACGFSDPLYFSRLFRRWTGTSPSAYQLSCRVRG